MEKENFDKILQNAGPFTDFIIKYSNRNKTIERKLISEGETGKLKLKFKDSGAYLNVNLIGGYDSISYLREELPTGMC